MMQVTVQIYGTLSIDCHKCGTRLAIPFGHLNQVAIGMYTLGIGYAVRCGCGDIKSDGITSLISIDPMRPALIIVPREIEDNGDR